MRCCAMPPDLIAIVDRSWTVTYLSGAAHRLIGELTVGADFLSLLAPEACGDGHHSAGGSGEFPGQAGA